MSRKYFIAFPNTIFNDFIVPERFRELKRRFYKSNMLGFLEKDIDEEGSIYVNEFDLDAIPKPPFLDTPPEEVKKDLLEDYLIPLLKRTEHHYINSVKHEYSMVVNTNDSAIINLKEQKIDELNYLLIETKRIKHLTSGLKKPLITSLDLVLDNVHKIIRTSFSEDFGENKIKLKLSQRAICHLMLYFNEQDILERKFSQTELANLIEMHFQSQVGKSLDFKNIVNVSATISSCIDKRSEPDAKLEECLVDYKKTIPKFKNLQKSVK
ncbi:hypothetical protein [Leeuwenhoekiella sp. LLG6367-2.1]|uniref:hypothetical protein n=1 Tax=Leeuwenhoekiella sp. LLG6367-2.1 TaxID=3160833 RepID=UPI00386DC179